MNWVEILAYVWAFCMSIILSSYILCGWGRPGRPFYMSSEREAYLQLVLGLLMCLGVALWVSYSDWTVNFFPPPPIIPMGAG